MEKLIAGAASGLVAGVIIASTWTGTKDLQRIEDTVENYSAAAINKITELKSEIQSLTNDKENLNREIDKLTKEKQNIENTAGSLSNELEKANKEIEKANKETKETADKVEYILDIDNLK